ncbi:MAG: hypothetical protein AAGG01_22685, partial [Planctomycetota bacterium]
PEVAQRIAALPDAEIFLSAGDGALVRGRLQGGGGEVASAVHRVPSATLPGADSLVVSWRPLAEWGTLVPLRASPMEGPVLGANRAGELTPVRIVRGGRAVDPSAVITSLGNLLSWAEMAPRRRLVPLRFVADDTAALILGAPLPPVRGQLLWQHPWGTGGALIPSGFRLDPELPAEALLKVLARPDADADEPRLLAEDHAIFDQEGWSVLRASNWVQLSRASLRETLAVSRRSSREPGAGP